MTFNTEKPEPDGFVGTRDGLGCGDHDQPYHFGRQPRSDTTYPFSTREYARLLLLRGRIQDRDLGERNLRNAA
jgi:hypothetical protein